MKILMLTLYLPYPPNSGGQIRSYNLIKNLSQKHEITLVSLIKKGEEKYAPELEKYCKKVVYFYRPEKPWTLTNIIKTGFSPYPFVVMRNYTPAANSFLGSELSQKHYDLIHIETFYLMPHIPATTVPILLVDQTIEYQVYQHYVDTFRHFWLRPLLYIDVFKLKFWETKFWRQAAMVGAVSEADKQKMLSLAPGIKVGLIPNAPGEDLANLYKSQKPNFKKPVIFYQSNFHWLQNIEGAKILAEEVFPLVKKQIPGAICRIVGQDAQGKVGNLAKGDVEVIDLPTTDIAGVVRAYRDGTVFVAPLRGPGGTRLKILGAMTAGVPVVTTSVGIQGLEAKKETDVMIGNSSQELAGAVIKLLSDQKTYNHIRKNAKKLVEEKYDWKTISDNLNAIYEKTANNA